MTEKVFTVYDSKIEAFLPPWHARTSGEAIRQFTDAAMDTKTQFSRHPSDFTLFEIGSFDNLTGTFTNLKAHASLGTALQLIESVRGQNPQLGLV